jgi:hypothetical protein
MQAHSHGRALQQGVASTASVGYVPKVRLSSYNNSSPDAYRIRCSQSLNATCLRLQRAICSHAVRRQHSQHSSPALLQHQHRVQHNLQQQQGLAWSPAARPAGRQSTRAVSTNSTAEAISIGGWAITVQKGGLAGRV